ncbi:MAG: S8 family serine peptidase [Oscillospiraceae bacterium]|jgi:subtilisin family serine protease|nr:S8 family serine peptidase [Oscillospiraceae bacterium]
MPYSNERPEYEEINKIFDAAMSTGEAVNTPKREVIVKYSGSLDKLASDLNAQVELLGEDSAIVTLLREDIKKLYNYPEIEYFELSKRLVLTLLSSAESACITSVRDSADYGNLSGEGILVSIIDSGVDYTHPAFINADNTTRIRYIWDQTTPSEAPPSGFKYGTEYTSEQINQALASENPLAIIPQLDVLGHGTAVCGAAAGNGRSQQPAYTGVAPKAAIMAVKLGRNEGEGTFARTTELMRAVKYSYDKAAELGMPLVVNISYGSNDGAHDGVSIFESYLNKIAQRGKSCIIVASGNEGAAGHHFHTVLRNEPVVAEFSMSENITSLYATIWKNFADVVSVEIVSPSGMSSGNVNIKNSPALVHLDGAIIYINAGQPSHYSTAQEIFALVSPKGKFLSPGLGKIILKPIRIVDGRVDIWLPTLEEVTDRTSFLHPTTETTLTIPSTAFNVITVGGYNSKLDAEAAFSGRGYTRNNEFIKPDLVAPAVDVVSCRAGGGYGTFTGTSIAAPIVSGASALLMEWGIVKGNDPFLYGQRLKAFLQRNAARNPDREYPNPIWGYGTLCLKEAIDNLITFKYLDERRNLF